MLVMQWRVLIDRTQSRRVREQAYIQVYEHFLENKMKNYLQSFRNWLSLMPEREFVGDIFNPVLTHLFIKTLSVNRENLPEHRNENQIYAYVYICLRNFILKHIERKRGAIPTNIEDDLLNIVDSRVNDLRDIENYDLLRKLNNLSEDNARCLDLIKRKTILGFQYMELKTKFENDYGNMTIENLRQMAHNCRQRLANYVGNSLRFSR